MTLLNKRLSASRVVDHLRTNGLFVSKKHFDAETVDMLNNEFDLLLRHQFDGVKERRRIRGTRIFRIKFDKFEKSNFPTFVNVFFSSFFKNVADLYLPSDSIFNYELVATYDMGNPEIVNDHFDTLRALKFMIYLMDTDERNGAFCYAPRTHFKNSDFRKQQLRFGGSPPSLPCVLADDAEKFAEPIIGPAGTLIIFDTEGFHRASNMAEGTERRILRSRCLFPNQSLEKPMKFSRQWIWEHRFNPIRLFAPKRPEGRLTGEEWRRGRRSS
jgi:hypothetical protein